MQSKTIYTIGFEGKSDEEFIFNLTENDIGLIVDVRLNNRSAKDGYASYPAIMNLLEQASIKYINDRMLAPDGQIRQGYTEHKDWKEYSCRFHELMGKRNIYSYINRTYQNQETTICLLCKEKDPDQCHRSLVAQYFSLVLDAKVVHL